MTTADGEKSPPAVIRKGARMRSIMIAGLLIVLLIVGILTMQNMGYQSNDGQSETQAREYIDRAEDAAEAVEDKMKALEGKLNPAE